VVIDPTLSATADTARLPGDLPGREPVVVFTASLLSYLTASARTAFAAQLRQAAGQRPGRMGPRGSPRSRRGHRPWTGRHIT
jgi:hypothetical protein